MVHSLLVPRNFWITSNNWTFWRKEEINDTFSVCGNTVYWPGTALENKSWRKMVFTTLIFCRTYKLCIITIFYQNCTSKLTVLFPNTVPKGHLQKRNKGIFYFSFPQKFPILSPSFLSRKLVSLLLVQGFSPCDNNDHLLSLKVHLTIVKWKITDVC